MKRPRRISFLKLEKGKRCRHPREESHLPQGISGTWLKLLLSELYLNYLSKIANVKRREKRLLKRVARVRTKATRDTFQIFS